MTVHEIKFYVSYSIILIKINMEKISLEYSNLNFEENELLKNMCPLELQEKHLNLLEQSQFGFYPIKAYLNNQSSDKYLRDLRTLKFVVNYITLNILDADKKLNTLTYEDIYSFIENRFREVKREIRVHMSRENYNEDIVLCITPIIRFFAMSCNLLKENQSFNVNQLVDSLELLFEFRIYSNKKIDISEFYCYYLASCYCNHLNVICLIHKAFNLFNEVKTNKNVIICLKIIKAFYEKNIPKFFKHIRDLDYLTHCVFSINIPFLRLSWIKEIQRKGNAATTCKLVSLNKLSTYLNFSKKSELIQYLKTIIENSELDLISLSHDYLFEIKPKKDIESVNLNHSYINCDDIERKMRILSF